MGTRLLYSLLTSCPMVSVGAHEKSRVQNLHLVHARRGRGSGVTSPKPWASSRSMERPMKSLIPYMYTLFRSQVRVEMVLTAESGLAQGYLLIM